MIDRPALVRLVADAADDVVRTWIAGQGYEIAPALSAQTIRRYLSQHPFRDVSIEVFRDAAWGADGGYVRLQVRSLVHPVQDLLAGASQSLVAPRAGTPLLQFELGPHPDAVLGSWPIRAPGDVTAFAKGFAQYLQQAAVPWLQRTQSMDAVFAFLDDLGQHEDRERLRAAWDAVR